jgi:hypothetical protein
VLIDVSSYPADTEVPSFQRRAKCSKCGGKRVRRAPKLEGAATERKPDREAVAVSAAMGLNR